MDEEMAQAAGRLCCLCELPAHGVHFDVPSCRACAAFFRRTVSLSLTYRCTQNSLCDVTKKYRYTCRACRYKKALKCGMNPSLVQNARVSSEASPTTSSSPEGCRLSAEIVDSPLSDCSPFRQSAGAREVKVDVTVDPSTASLAAWTDQTALIKVIHDIFQEPRTSFYTPPPGEPPSMLQQAIISYAQIRAGRAGVQVDYSFQWDAERLVKFVYSEMINIALFCMSLEDFSQLEDDQKWLLFRRLTPRFMAMERFQATTELLGFDPDDPRTVLYDGQVIDTTAVDVGNLRQLTHIDAKEMVRLFKDSCDVSQQTLIRPLKKLRPSEFEIVFSLIIMLFEVEHEEGASGSTKTVSEQVLEKIAEEMHNYYTKELNQTSYAGRLSRIMSAVSALDRIEDKHREDMVLSKTFSIFKHDIFFSEVLGGTSSA